MGDRDEGGLAQLCLKQLLNLLLRHDVYVGGCLI